MLCCIGVDVGGTNTDAVLLCGRQVISTVKTPTTYDVISGVRRALRELLLQVKETESLTRIIQLNIGTTHFANALVQRRGLAKVSVLRLCGPSSRGIPPFGDFPSGLANIIQGEVYNLGGGYQYNGREITPIDEDHVCECVRDSLQKGVQNFVISGIFSPVNPSQEDKVRNLISSTFPEVSLTLSHEIGHIGLMERENAAILNETLKPLSQRTVKAFQTALHDFGLTCPFYLTQNDGTVISCSEATRFPIFTISSGPTNSMRGAAFLCDVSECIVIDIGGTTTDVGALEKNFPREAAKQIKVAEVQTNFRMPDVFSIGLGGGSLVNINKTGSKTSVSVGPLSTGYRLMTDGIAFGGNNFTATDAAILTGMVDLGNKDKIKERVTLEDAKLTIEKIRDIIEDCVDQMKTSNKDVIVVLVGGGSILVDQNTTKLQGVKQLIKPPHFDVANAIGAALSQISGMVDQVVSLENVFGKESFEKSLKKAEELAPGQYSDAEKHTIIERKKTELFSEAKKSARQRAVEKATEIAVKFGADISTIELVEVSDISLAYLPGSACRVKVKVVGDLSQDEGGNSSVLVSSLPLSKADDFSKSDVKEEEMPSNHTTCNDAVKFKINPITYQPIVGPSTGEWIVSEYDIECIAIGSGILGCGGGGSPYLGKIMVQRKLREGKHVRIISVDRYEKMANPETDRIGMVALMGAPLVMTEKIFGGEENKRALETLEYMVNTEDYGANTTASQGGTVQRNNAIVACDDLPDSVKKSATESIKQIKITAVMSAEIGGLNSVTPFLVAAEKQLHVLDCDGMGRAFPELQMFTPYIYGQPPFPATLADDKGRQAVAFWTKTPKDLEDYFRKICSETGAVGIACNDMKPGEVAKKTVSKSLSRAWSLGLAVLQARFKKSSPVSAILSRENGKLLITGKVIEVNRETSGGFNRGETTIQGIGEHIGKSVKVDFQNENLIVRSIDPPEILATVPDLIAFVDYESGEPITTEETRFGLRVSVLLLPSCPEMATPEALAVVGPKAFGYDDVVYKPFSQYASPSGVPK